MIFILYMQLEFQNRNGRKYFNFIKWTSSIPRLNSIMLRWSLSKKDVLKQLEHIDVDLYYAFSDRWSQEFCYDCSRSFNRPYAVRIKGDYIKDLDAKNRNALIWVSKRSKLESYRHADRIIPVSKNVYDLANEWIGDAFKLSQIVPSGVDTTKFRPASA